MRFACGATRCFSLPIGGVHKSARLSGTLGASPWSPVRNDSPSRNPLPATLFKSQWRASRESAACVHSHAWNHLWRKPTARCGEGSGLRGGDSRRPVCVSAFTQSLPTYICIVTLYGNNVCDHSARRPTATSFNRSPRRLFCASRASPSARRAAATLCIRTSAAASLVTVSN